jgi:hypothetical protein
LFTPNILEWTASHSKKIGVHTFPLQIGVHEVKSWSAFSLTLFVPLIFKDSSKFQIFFLHFEGWGKPWKYSFSIKMPP